MQSRGDEGSAVHAPAVLQLPAVKHLLAGVQGAPGVGVGVQPVGSTQSFSKHWRVLGVQVTGGPARHVPSEPLQ